MARTGPNRRTVLAVAGTSLITAVAGCGAAATPSTPTPGTPTPARSPVPAPTPHPAPVPSPDRYPPAATMTARATVPVLCWHQLRDWGPDDSASSRASLICPPARFRTQLDGIRAAGFTTIGPDDYLAHLTTGSALPPRPVILSFDDSRGSQIEVGLPELRARAMTATFFVMTVPLDKPGWMSRADVRRLHDSGMTVAAHTYDHSRADRWSGPDWATQLDRPRRDLERITGAPVVHFAYPYGAWSTADFAHLDAAGYRTAFQLADHPLDPGRPLLTLRRKLTGSEWDGERVVTELGHPPDRLPRPTAVTGG